MINSYHRRSSRLIIIGVSVLRAWTDLIFGKNLERNTFDTTNPRSVSEMKRIYIAKHSADSRALKGVVLVSRLHVQTV